jgi:hypothetical protein
MVYDSVGSDAGDGSDDIVGSETAFETFFAEIFSHVITQCFEDGGFGDIKAEVRMGEDFLEVVVDFAGFSHDAVFVVFLSLKQITITYQGSQSFFVNFPNQGSVIPSGPRDVSKCCAIPKSSPLYCIHHRSFDVRFDEFAVIV